jgi:protein-disulfide isomerase/uncharacterized membrane protein
MTMAFDKMKRNPTPLLAVFALMGAGISLWQTRLYHLTRSGRGDMKSFCNINATFDCTAVEMSRYSELPGGLPLSGFAIAGYLLILTLSLFALHEGYRRAIRPWLIGLTSVALGFSAFYLAIMVGVIGKLCLLCLFVDGINSALFVLSWMTPGKGKEPNQPFPLAWLASIGAGSLLIAFLATKGLDPMAEIKSADLEDHIESIVNTPVTPIQLPAGVFSVGPANAPITLVKFSDYECPACRLGATSIHPLFKRFEKQVRFVFINFPLASECNPELKRTIHQYACESAAVAICAGEQGRFIEAYEALFSRQSDFKKDGIADLLLSQVSGLDAARLKSCAASPSTLDKVRLDAAFGASLKVQSTPTFFVNGRKVEGGLPTRIWIEVIERILKK